MVTEWPLHSMVMLPSLLCLMFKLILPPACLRPPSLVPESERDLVFVLELRRVLPVPMGSVELDAEILLFLVQVPVDDRFHVTHVRAAGGVVQLDVRDRRVKGNEVVVVEAEAD